MRSPESTAHTAATLAEVLSQAVRDLREAGVDTPDRDARLLIAAALGVDQLQLIARRSEPLGGAEQDQIDAVIGRRLQREPVSRILGRRSFYGRDFLLTPATLDPRPDTETLVDLALEIVDIENWRSRPVRIVDVGTGSGCILLTLLAELPLATGLGVDISSGALETARENAARLGVANRTQFVCGRSLGNVTDTFDLLVSNPPYIPSRDIAGLEPEVRGYDPINALDGGSDGYDVFREIAADFRRIVPTGWAIVEVGAGQASDVQMMLQHSPADATLLREDLGGHTRCVAVKTHS